MSPAATGPKQQERRLDFPIGSPFSLAVKGVPNRIQNEHNNLDGHVAGGRGERAVVRVLEGAMLRIQTASVSAPPFDDCVAGSDESGRSTAVTLFLASDENDEPLPLCPFMLQGSALASSTALVVTSLGVEVCGPRTITLSVEVSLGNATSKRSHSRIDFSVNVFGSVVACPWTKSVQQNGNSDILERRGRVSVSITSFQPALSNDEQGKRGKRKRSDKEKSGRPNHGEFRVDETNRKEVATGDREEINADSAPADIHETQTRAGVEKDEPNSKVSKTKTSKRARKALAKQKQKELREVLAKEQGSDVGKSGGGNRENPTPVVNSNKSSLSTKILAERRLRGGVVVKDIIIGNGKSVKSGRKVAVLYQGTFRDGKVFDKNKDRRNPLRFRLGTGEVIRGLEIGMEEMREGGERTIVIPPDLGYGKEGSKGLGADIPGNATLIFDVQLLSSSGSHP